MSASMHATIAYIDRNTKWWDVDFHVSRRYEPEAFKQYIYHLNDVAKQKKVRILEITVFRDDKEIWRGLV